MQLQAIINGQYNINITTYSLQYGYGVDTVDANTLGQVMFLTLPEGITTFASYYPLIGTTIESLVIRDVENDTTIYDDGTAFWHQVEELRSSLEIPGEGENGTPRVVTTLTIH